MRTIFEWTVCGTRALKTNELQAALTLSLTTKFSNMNRIISELCGQLLYIDKDGAVQPVHLSLRDILVDDMGYTPLQLRPKLAHERLATACLRYLLSEEMRPPRHPALLLQNGSRSAFASYACSSFSEHLFSRRPYRTMCSNS